MGLTGITCLVKGRCQVLECDWHSHQNWGRGMLPRETWAFVPIEEQRRLDRHKYHCPQSSSTLWKWENVTQSCPTLCDPMDCSPPGSSVHGILQARILEWVAILFSRASSRSRGWTQVSCTAGGFINRLSHQGMHLCKSLSVMPDTLESKIFSHFPSQNSH